MQATRFCSPLVMAVVLGLAGPTAAAEYVKKASLILTVQSRDSQGQRVRQAVAIDPAKTAVIVVDMWDRHWCATYTSRVANLVPRMNLTLSAARKLGLSIVFAPSDVADFYRDWPQRKAMQMILPYSEPKTVGFDAPPPPGPTDCCECGPEQPCTVKHKVWTRQHADLRIAPEDLIGDCNNGHELLNLCVQRGIETLVYMGVASNMCVQFRAMGIRNMKNHALRTIVVADLVEAITSNGLDSTWKKNLNFTPAGGSARIQAHLEQFISPTIESRQLIEAAGMGQRTNDKRPHVVFVIAEKEYESHKTLPEFASHYLGNQYRCRFLNATANEGTGPDSIPGLDSLYDADLLVLSVRRRALPVVQMDHLERYLRSGKPLVALRVSAAAFAPSQAPRGHVIWERFDRDVLGCNYAGYNTKSRATGCEVWRVPEASGNPVLNGVTTSRWHSACWIYRQRPLNEGTTVILMGRWGQEDPEEPVAWIRPHEGSRVFYTTLGHPQDFKQEPFNQLLVGAVHWTLGER